MSVQKLLLTGVVALSVTAMSHQAHAVLVTGSSGGSFSSVSSCGGDNCRINNTSNGSHTQVEWGYASRSSGSTLTADDVTWNVGTPANNVVIAELTWFNRSTSADVTPDNYGVHYNLTITFTAPGSSSDTETFDLSITNTNNPTGDLTAGLTMADLSGLSFSLAGVTVSDLHFSTDGLGGSSFSGSTWRDPEDTTSHLFLTADFTATAVPEPATLGLFGASLIGLGVVRRRRRAS